MLAMNLFSFPFTHVSSCKARTTFLDNTDGVYVKRDGAILCTASLIENSYWIDLALQILILLVMLLPLLLRVQQRP